MTFRSFESTFNEILYETPLPNGDVWKLQTLQKADLPNNQGWTEVLYRTNAYYQCNRRHYWQSSWGMILFRFHLDASAGYGRIRMKRFGQRCNKCKNDDTYHVGFCNDDEVWKTVQCLLLNILQRCYEGRRECDVDTDYYIIPISDVQRGNFGGTPHQKDFCEACAHDRCQEKFKKLTKRK